MTFSTEEILTALQERGFFEARVADDTAAALVRRRGRVAARTLGWKVRTYSSRRRHGSPMVVIDVIESNPEHQERKRVWLEAEARRMVNTMSEDFPLA